MQHAIKCDSQDKPDKNEVVRFMPTDWIRLRHYPDSDLKRISACQDLSPNRAKKH